MVANGNVLFTLRDAANHVMALPKKESALPHWQLAVECLLGAAERRRPVMMARIAVVKALTHGQAVEPPAPRTGLSAAHSASTVGSPQTLAACPKRLTRRILPAHGHQIPRQAL